MRSLLVTLLAALAAAATLSACTDDGVDRAAPTPSASASVAPSADPTTVAPVTGGRLRFGVVGAPATLDPYSPIASDLTYALARPVYPSLFELDPEGRPYRSLAVTMTPVSDGVRVRLKRTRWSDGSPIDARDVVASIRRAQPPSGFARIASVKILSAHEVALKGSIGNWRRALATLSFVLPNGVVGGNRVRLVGGGPFRIASYTPGLHVVYRRNGGSRLTEPPLLRSLVVEFVESEDVLLKLLADGRVDAAAPPSTVNLADRLDGIAVNYDAALGWESVHLAIEPSLAPADRAALVAAIDRAALIDAFVRDDGRLANTLHPQPDGADGAWDGSLGKRARVPTPVKLAIPIGDELLTLMQRALQIQLTEAHMNVEPVAASASDFYGLWRIDDPVDAGIVRTAGAPGLRDSRAALRNLTALPVAQVKTYLTWRRPVHGLQVNPTFAGPLWNAESWWIDH